MDGIALRNDIISMNGIQLHLTLWMSEIQMHPLAVLFGLVDVGNATGNLQASRFFLLITSFFNSFLPTDMRNSQSQSSSSLLSMKRENVIFAKIIIYAQEPIPESEARWLR